MTEDRIRKLIGLIQRYGERCFGYGCESDLSHELLQMIEREMRKDED